MATVTISRGSYSKGKEVAEKLAQKLGYECISRDILIDTSDHFNIPEIKLIRALHDSPSILDRFTHGKERYVAYIKERVLNHVRKDNIVYHGLAGHYFLQGIPHVMKVRVIARMEDRIRVEMDREKSSAQEARQILIKDDDERRKWGLYLYGIDTWDPRLYDVVLHIDKLKVDDVVDILINALQRPCFQTTPESERMIHDLAVAAKVEAALVENFPTAKASCKGGVVHLRIDAPRVHERRVNATVKELLGDMEGIQQLEVQIIPYVTPY
jgi:cytidylate kinase